MQLSQCSAIWRLEELCTVTRTDEHIWGAASAVQESQGYLRWEQGQGVVQGQGVEGAHIGTGLDISTAATDRWETRRQALLVS